MLVTLGALRVKVAVGTKFTNFLTVATTAKLNKRYKKYKRRFGWKNLKKIETDCNCDLWKLVSQTDFKDHFCCYV